MIEETSGTPPPEDTLAPQECLEAWARAVAGYVEGHPLEASVGPDVGGWPVLSLTAPAPEALGLGLWRHYGFGVSPWRGPGQQISEGIKEIPEIYLTTTGNEEAIIEAFTILIESLQATSSTQPAVPGLMLYHPGSILGEGGPDAWVIGWDLTPIILPILDLGVSVRYLPAYPIYRTEIALLEKVGLSRFLARIGPAINDLSRPALSIDSPGGPEEPA